MRPDAMAITPRSISLRLVLVLFLAAAIGGCDLLPAGAIPTVGGVLVTVETSGGNCQQGPCGSRYLVHLDGRVERSDGERQQLSSDQLARIVELAAVTDWAAVRARPFTGECPTAYDGQKVVYTFERADGPVGLDSCESDLSGIAVFAAIDEALFAADG